MSKITAFLYQRSSPFLQSCLNMLSCVKNGKMRKAAYYFIWARKYAKLYCNNENVVECECCGWMGNAFFPYYDPAVGYKEDMNEVCPVCNSKSRFRLLVRYLKKHKHLLMSKDIQVVEIGHAKSFQDWIKTYSTVKYVSINLDYRTGVDVCMDIRQIGIKNKSVDVLICSHVLEHVKDDIEALKQMRSILRPDGLALILVPVDRKREETLEYCKANQREYQHVRTYGNDFVERLNNAGFKINYSDLDFAGNLSLEDVVRYGIKPKDQLFVVYV